MYNYRNTLYISTLCSAMVDSLAARQRNRSWVAWDIILTTPGLISSIPYFLAAKETGFKLNIMREKGSKWSVMRKGSRYVRRKKVQIQFYEKELKPKIVLWDKVFTFSVTREMVRVQYNNMRERIQEKRGSSSVLWERVRVLHYERKGSSSVLLEKWFQVQLWKMVQV